MFVAQSFRAQNVVWKLHDAKTNDIRTFTYKWLSAIENLVRFLDGYDVVTVDQRKNIFRKAMKMKPEELTTENIINEYKLKKIISDLMKKNKSSKTEMDESDVESEHEQKDESDVALNLRTDSKAKKNASNLSNEQKEDLRRDVLEAAIVEDGDLIDDVDDVDDDDDDDMDIDQNNKKEEMQQSNILPHSDEDDEDEDDDIHILGNKEVDGVDVEDEDDAVSYTHLTLPTICSV